MIQNKKGGDGLEKFFIGLGKNSLVLLKICHFGLKRINFKNVDMWCIFLIITTFLGAAILGTTNYIHKALLFVFGEPLQVYIRLFFKMSASNQYIALVTLLILSSLAILGFKEFKKYVLFQKAIDRVGLKNAIGEKPKVKSIQAKSENRHRVLVEAFGVGIGKFASQNDSLVAGFRQNVESINVAEDKGMVEIHLCERDLPKMVHFNELYNNIKEPYSFIVGQSLKGPVVQSIRSLPHLLVSGTTGGGKSVFFRSAMLSLLKSSPHIQLYLLDLKRGVEVKEFTDLPNVKTAKDEIEATNILGALVNEMNLRYKYLEKSGYKSIEPKRDKKDLIVVGIDEAAALFGKKSNELASKYVAELARLARAAGIHLCPSTQKPVASAINTETLDNLPGRITFKMISSAASNVAMGGNFAKKLPAIKGRAMWTNGSEHREVQAPFVDDTFVEKEIKDIKEDFECGKRKNFQSLITAQTEVEFTKMTESKDEQT